MTDAPSLDVDRSAPSPDVVRSRLEGRAREQALGYFGLHPDDERDLRAAIEAVVADDALTGQVAKVVGQYRAHLGGFPEWGEIDLPERFTPGDATAPVTDRFFYPVALAVMLPDTLTYHRARRIDETASRAIWADVGRHLRVFHTTFGHTGLHVQSWFVLHAVGLIYDFGRLQFNRGIVHLSQDEIDAAGMPVRPGDHVLACHIPDSGPLDPDEVEASLRRAAPFFAEHFPDEGPYTVVTCGSWLLDEQLIDMVPGSNIAKFCALWKTIVPASDDDPAVLNFVFRRPDATVEELPTNTHLERAIVEHLRAGRHMQSRRGWLALADHAGHVES